MGIFVNLTGIYSTKIENSKMFIRINDTSDENYSRIGQIIFKLKDSQDNDVTSGVSLSGVFTSSLYDIPRFDQGIYDNWSITKKAGVPHSGFQTEEWLEVLSVPGNATHIQIDATGSSPFGQVSIRWYQMTSGNSTAGFESDINAVLPSEIQTV